MSYLFIIDYASLKCAVCKKKNQRAVKVSVCFRSIAGKDLSAFFCEECFKKTFSYHNERKETRVKA